VRVVRHAGRRPVAVTVGVETVSVEVTTPKAGSVATMIS